MKMLCQKLVFEKNFFSSSHQIHLHSPSLSLAVSMMTDRKNERVREEKKREREKAIYSRSFVIKIFYGLSTSY
jgi:hypothetical protein